MIGSVTVCEAKPNKYPLDHRSMLFQFANKWANIKILCVTANVKAINCGHFQFYEKFRFEFPKIFSDEWWNSLFKNFLKRGQPCEYIVCQKVRKFLPANFSSDIPPGISGIFGWMVRFSEIQQFPNYLETFQKISAPYVHVSKFLECLLERRAPGNSLTLRRLKEHPLHKLYFSS